MRELSALLGAISLVVLPNAKPAVACIPAAPACSTFDTDLDGWTSNSLSEVSWSATGGNPDGYARYVDQSAAETFLHAPDEFLGDWSHLDGIGMISFDQKLFELGGGVTDIGACGVHIAGPCGNEASWNGADLTGPTDWVNITIPLVESNWHVTGSWATLLSNVTSLRINMEMVTNTAGAPNDIVGLDNICLVPEPTTLSLLGLGSLAWLRRKRV